VRKKSFFVSDKVTVTMTPKTFTESLVEMVVKEGIPIRFFSSAACKKNMREMARRLHVSLDREKVVQYVLDEANRLKTDLKKRILRRSLSTW
jgi:hypothetical protein